MQLDLAGIATRAYNRNSPSFVRLQVSLQVVFEFWSLCTAHLYKLLIPGFTFGGSLPRISKLMAILWGRIRKFPGLGELFRIPDRSHALSPACYVWMGLGCAFTDIRTHISIRDRWQLDNMTMAHFIQFRQIVLIPGDRKRMPFFR